jgi:hypothetical protein
MTLEIKPFLTLSTAHITQDSSEYLQASTGDNSPNRDGPAVGDWPYGYFIYCDEEPLPDWPEDVRAVMAFARKHGCEYLLLDRDADTTEELPQYDW